MKKNIIIASEGLTDCDTLEPIIKKIASKYGIQCHFNVFFPERDNTSGNCTRRGWTSLRDKLKEFNPNQPVSAPLLQDKDKEIWQAAGMLGPTKASPATWAIVQGVENSLLIFHIDGDVAFKIHEDSDIEDFGGSPDKIYDFCKSCLQSWSGVGADSAIFVVPVQCLETWFLRTYNEFKSDELIENINTEDVYKILIGLGCQKYRDDKGNILPDKIYLIQTQLDLLLKRWEDVCIECSSADRFDKDLNSFFERMTLVS